MSSLSDWEIIGFYVSAYSGCIIIATLLLNFIKNTLNDSSIHNEVKWPTIISLSTAFLYCFCNGFIRTNLLFSDESFSLLQCKISFSISYVFYQLSKFAMYILFTYRIQIVFGDSPYRVSSKMLNIMRYFMIFLAAIFCVLLFLVNKTKLTTPKYKLSLCTEPGGEFEANIGTLGIMFYGLTDFIFSSLLFWLFASKLHKMSKLFLREQSSENWKLISRIRSSLIKSTILVLISIISTWIITFVGNFIWAPLQWFTAVDMIINSLSIYLMYGFAERTYLFCCKPCIKCFGYCQNNDAKSVAELTRVKSIESTSPSAQSIESV